MPSCTKTYKEWEALRLAKREFSQFLESVSIDNIRGIKSLQVNFDYPVSVLFGANASGKTTVLQACSCAYRVPGHSVKDFVPSTVFHWLRNTNDIQHSDAEDQITIGFDYLSNKLRSHMDWKKNKRWGRSYRGMEGGNQLARQVYFRTLASMTNPSEVRNYLQIGKRKSITDELPVEQYSLARKILPIQHAHVFRVTDIRNRELLYAENERGEGYSEFHMSAGERAILHLSRELTSLRDALVLIDEAETGLHPYCQQILMVELQRLALRNHLQIIVATHSLSVIESVPVEARIFLDRRGDEIRVGRYDRPVIQQALYGQSLDKLSILCEDEIAESIVRGVFEHINHELGLAPGDVVIERDTGVDEYPNYITAFSKVRVLNDFLFVIDGDTSAEQRSKLLKNLESNVYLYDLLELPKGRPEEWIWSRIFESQAHYANSWGVAQAFLTAKMNEIKRSTDGAPGHETERIKQRFFLLAQELQKEQKEICRQVARHEAEMQHQTLREFQEGLNNQIRKWLSLNE
jgi:predicted ATPase